jgi:DNA-binding CsgD family transcriptional regulator
MAVKAKKCQQFYHCVSAKHPENTTFENTDTMIKKTETENTLLGESVRNLIVKNSHLLTVLNLFGLRPPYGRNTVNELIRTFNLSEDVFVALLEVSLGRESSPHKVLPSYGLLQLSDLYGKLATHLVATAKGWLNLRKQTGPDTEHGMAVALSGLIAALEQHLLEWNQQAAPHIGTVYELYYSPAFTSGKNDLLSYSLEFFPQHRLPLAQIEAVSDRMENALNPHEPGYILEILHYLELARTLERLEKTLIKPMVMAMENTIVSGIQRRKSGLRRGSFVRVEGSEVADDPLSEREREVLRCIANGQINKEIATFLGISLTTVISHRKNIARKLGIHSLAGLTVYAYTHGYLDLDD